MRPKRILKKIEKHKVWNRRFGDTWCNLEKVTVKEILVHHKKSNQMFISLKEADFLWLPSWLCQHYEPDN